MRTLYKLMPLTFQSATSGLQQRSPLARPLTVTRPCTGTALAAAILVPNVEFIFGLLGSTASVLIAYMLPAALFLSLSSRPALLVQLNPGDVTTGAALSLVGSLAQCEINSVLKESSAWSALIANCRLSNCNTGGFAMLQGPCLGCSGRPASEKRTPCCFSASWSGCCAHEPPSRSACWQSVACLLE
jgi:hypothetical protein